MNFSSIGELLIDQLPEIGAFAEVELESGHVPGQHGGHGKHPLETIIRDHVSEDLVTALHH